MRKAAVIIIAIAVALFSFNEREIFKKDIRNRLVVQGVGIDTEPDGSYSLTVQAIATSSRSLSAAESGGENPVKIYKVKGNTVYTAIRSIIEYDGKIPLYSQNRIIVIGREAAERGIEGIVDFFVRDVENSASLRIAMADGRAEEVLSVTSENGEVIARNIEQAIRSAEFEPEIFELHLYELINRYLDDNSACAMPLLSVEKETDAKDVELKATAVFRGARAAGSVSREQTVMINFLCNRIYNGALAYETESGEKISVSIIDSKTKRKVRLEGDIPVFDIDIELECDVAEIHNGVSKRISAQRLKEIENSANRYIKEELEKTVNRLYRELKCDVAGLSRLLYIGEADFYRRHEDDPAEVMAGARFNISVDAGIRRVGQEFVEIS